MSLGVLSLIERHGARDEFPLHVATLSVGTVRNKCWLTIQSQTMPLNWIDPQTDNPPEYPFVEATVEIAGADLAMWVGRTFRFEYDIAPDAVRRLAWVHTTSGYDCLCDCELFVGEHADDSFAVCFAARGIVSRCSILLNGLFTLVDVSPQLEQFLIQL